VIRQDTVTAHPDETLLVVVNRMALSGQTQLPVVDPKDSNKLVGMVSLRDLLHARVRNLEEERNRERILRLRRLFRPGFLRAEHPS
jgi:CBS domain-containing protein